MKELINQKVVVRCYYAGNWAGKVTAIDEVNKMIKLENAFRLWSWQAKNGISLSEVATNGVTGGEIRKPVPFTWLNIKDCYEFIPLSDGALQTLINHSK